MLKAYAENPTGVVTNDTGDLIDHDGNIISHVYSMSPDEGEDHPLHYNCC